MRMMPLIAAQRNRGTCDEIGVDEEAVFHGKSARKDEVRAVSS
jgi:hypothetical protein